MNSIPQNHGPEFYRKVEQVFGQLCDLPWNEQTEALEKLCDGAPGLKSIVLAMLQRDTESDPFFDENERVPDTQLFGLPKPGDIIDSYEILRLLGEGGMGAVYLARQREPVCRDVALKIVGSRLDSHGVISRFAAERQVLAIFDHPNLTRIFDGGITELGMPYFVMEYVPGESITSFCRNNSVDLKGRLQMFVDICDAIHHAHQKGVIHRDIKPSNILVTESDGAVRPKVIDFGIAKSVDSQNSPINQTKLTIVGDVIGTPLYMSPEQAESGTIAVDVRSDIYSLGVVLYELLTGTTPLSKSEFDSANCLRTLEAIRDHKAESPSTRVARAENLTTDLGYEILPQSLANKLRGDLDRVVGKALAKDRELRYGTVADFRNDITNYLEGNPVQAVAPSVGYKFKKFVLKYPWPSAITALLSIGIIISAFIAINQAFQNSIALSKNRNLVVQLQEQSKCLSEALKTTEKAKIEQRKVLRFKKYEVAIERAIVGFNKEMESQILEMFEQAHDQYESEEAPGFFTMAIDFGGSEHGVEEQIAMRKELLEQMNLSDRNAFKTGQPVEVNLGPDSSFEIEASIKNPTPESPIEEPDSSDTTRREIPFSEMMPPPGMMPTDLAMHVMGPMCPFSNSGLHPLESNNAATKQIETASFLAMQGIQCLIPAVQQEAGRLPVVYIEFEDDEYYGIGHFKNQSLKFSLRFCELFLDELRREFGEFDSFVGVTYDVIAQLQLELEDYGLARKALEQSSAIHASSKKESLELFSRILLARVLHGEGNSASAETLKMEIEDRLNVLQQEECDNQVNLRRCYDYWLQEID